MMKDTGTRRRRRRGDDGLWWHSEREGIFKPRCFSHFPAPCVIRVPSPGLLPAAPRTPLAVVLSQHPGAVLPLDVSAVILTI